MVQKSCESELRDQQERRYSLSLGQKIKELRMGKGLTQIDLAAGLCTASMISQIESDRARPSYKMLSAIAERLDVSLENLLVDVEMNLETVSSYKMAQAMVAAKEYVSAIPLLVELLNTSRSSISSIDIQFELLSRSKRVHLYVRTQIC